MIYKIYSIGSIENTKKMEGYASFAIRKDKEEPFNVWYEEFKGKPLNELEHLSIIEALKYLKSLKVYNGEEIIIYHTNKIVTDRLNDNQELLDLINEFGKKKVSFQWHFDKIHEGLMKRNYARNVKNTYPLTDWGI